MRSSCRIIAYSKRASLHFHLEQNRISCRIIAYSKRPSLHFHLELDTIITGIPNDPQWFLFMLLGLYALTSWLRMLLGSPNFQRTSLPGLISLLYGANLFALIQQMGGYSSEAIFPINSLIYLNRSQTENWSFSSSGSRSNFGQSRLIIPSGS